MRLSRPSITGSGAHAAGSWRAGNPDFQRAPSSGGPTVARELAGRVFGDAACVQVVRFPLSPTPSSEDAPVTPKRGTRRGAATTSPLPLAAVSGLHIPSKPGRGCCWRPLGAPPSEDFGPLQKRVPRGSQPDLSFAPGKTRERNRGETGPPRGIERIHNLRRNRSISI